MVMAVFVLFLLATTGIALLFLSENEVRMSQAALREKQAFYLAEAALEDGRSALYLTNKGEDFDDDLASALGADPSPGASFDPEAIRVVYDSDGNVTGFTGYGDDVPLAQTTSFPGGAYIAFLTNDAIDGRYDADDTNDRVMIAGVGAGPGRSMEVVEAIIEIRHLFPTIPPATITLIGPQPVFDGGNSSAKLYDGDDCGGAGIPGLYVPVLGVIGSSAVADPCPPSNDSVICGIHKPGTYQTDQGSITGYDTAADLTDPGVIGGMGMIDPLWADCDFLADLAEDVRYAADMVCRPPAACAWPPSSPIRTLFVDGDLTLGPTEGGAGLLFVTGRLTMHGRTDWHGMVYVVGKGELVRNGAGNGPISGAVFVADIAGPDNTYGTADDCTGGLNGLAPAFFDESGGGTGEHVFCTNDIDPALPVEPYKVREFLQR